MSLQLTNRFFANYQSSAGLKFDPRPGHAFFLQYSCLNPCTVDVCVSFDIFSLFSEFFCMNLQLINWFWAYLVDLREFGVPPTVYVTNPKILGSIPGRVLFLFSRFSSPLPLHLRHPLIYQCLCKFSDFSSVNFQLFCYVLHFFAISCDAFRPGGRTLALTSRLWPSSRSTPQLPLLSGRQVLRMSSSQHISSFNWL